MPTKKKLDVISKFDLLNSETMFFKQNFIYWSQ